ncbi:MAG: glycosyltransferase family 61 protein [Pseudomonadota bacterium]
MTSPISLDAPDVLDFVIKTDKLLSESAPHFDWAEIVKEGQAAGYLSPAEADAMKIRAILPNWLLKGLTERRPNEHSAIDPKGIELLGPYQFQIAPPAEAVCETSMLKWHKARTLTAEPMIAIQGGQSRHYLANFSKVSWSKDGVYTSLSDEAGQHLLPFLENVEPTVLEGRSFNAVVEGSVVYTHWLLDTLPRILFWIDQGHDIDEFDHFLFAGITTKFHRQTLDLLGIPDDKVVTRARHGPLFSVDDFTTVSQPRTDFATHPDTYARVRNLFLPQPSESKPSRCVYISRGKAGRRRVLNEDALEAVFERYGVEVLHLEDYSISETAAIIDSASHIIAPHGAGLANLVFARPGTKVLELFSAHLSREYWIISHQQGLEYHVFEAHGPDGCVVDDTAKEAMPFFVRNGTDIEIPIGKFEAYLDNKFFT